MGAYRYSWSKLFYNDEFDRHCYVGNDCPSRCPDHIDPETGRGWGFRCPDDLGPLDTAGHFDLKVPIDIRNEMPGQDQKILTLSAMGVHFGSFGLGWGTADIALLANGAELFKSKLEIPHDKWFLNSLGVNKSISAYTSLDLRLHMHAAVRLPSSWVSIHVAQIKLDCEYYADIPPETADVVVRVIDRETGKGISGAYTAIMSGAVVVADGFTDRDGYITFKAIEEGSYTLTASASGYREASLSINVAPPEVRYTIKLVPIPRPPIPWYVWASVIGGGVIGGIVILKKPKPPKPVIVVK